MGLKTQARMAPKAWEVAFCLVIQFRQRSHDHIVSSCWGSVITDVDSCVIATQGPYDGKVTGQVLAKGDDI